jgi:hypothetical protein
MCSAVLNVVEHPQLCRSVGQPDSSILSACVFHSLQAEGMPLVRIRPEGLRNTFKTIHLLSFN